MSDPAAEFLDTDEPALQALFDDKRLRVAPEFAKILRHARLDAFENWYDDDLVGRPWRRLRDRANVRVDLALEGGRTLTLFVKRHEPPGLMARLFYPHLSPARVESDAIPAVSRLGISTARAVLLGEDPDTGRSLFVAAEIEGGVEADHYARAHFSTAKRESLPARRRFAEKLGKLVRKLHAAKLSHRDLYLCHVFVTESADDITLHLIDLQRLAPFFLERWRVKDLAQLEFSRPVSALSRTDAVRFLHAYFKVDRLGPAHRDFARAVLAKTARIREHDRRKAARR